MAYCFARRLMSTATSTGSMERIAPAVSPSDERVQLLLQRVTRVDFERVYAIRKRELSLPRYRLLDEDQLRQVSYSSCTGVHTVQ